METIPEDNQEMMEISTPALTQTAPQNESKETKTKKETPEKELETTSGGLSWGIAAVVFGVVAAVGYAYLKKSKL